MPILLIAIVGMIIITSQSPAAFAGAGIWEDKDNDGNSTEQGDCDDTDPNKVAEEDCWEEELVEIKSDVNEDLILEAGDIVHITNGATVYGNIKIEGGTLILSGHATVKGNVESDKGGTLKITASTVEGNVKGVGGSTTINGATIIKGNVESDKEESVIILDSTINGNVVVKEAMSVTITGNYVNGNLEIDKPLGFCEDTGNDVTGSIEGCP